MKRGKAILITFLVTFFFGVFFLMPVADVLKQAFLDQNGQFSIAYLWIVFSNPIYLEGLWNAFALGVMSTIVTFFIALPLALVSYRWTFPGKKWLTVLVLAPLVRATGRGLGVGDWVGVYP